MSHFITTGAVGGKTEGAVAPNRLEINDFVKNEEMFSLYIQALGMWFTPFIVLASNRHTSRGDVQIFPKRLDLVLPDRRYSWLALPRLGRCGRRRSR